MKVIAKTGSGKTIFVSAFLGFLKDYIDNIENIYLSSPTFNQIGWDRISNILMILMVLLMLIILLL